MNPRAQIWLAGAVLTILGMATLLFGVPTVSDTLDHVRMQPVVDAKQDAKIEALKIKDESIIEILSHLKKESGESREILIRLETKMNQLEAVGQ
jgi:hypothetical protein